VRKAPVILLIPLRNRVEDFFIPTDPLLKVLDSLFAATPLLGVVCVALLKGDGEPSRDGSQHIGVDIVVAVEDGESRARRNRGGECNGAEGRG
jgi:hypothetical protein